MVSQSLPNSIHFQAADRFLNKLLSKAQQLVLEFFSSK